MMNWTHGRRVRQVVQALFFGLYIYLLIAALQRRATLPLADLFFRLDPLAAGGAMLAGRRWIGRLALALITLALTLTLGRVWCGWVCPLGTLLDWARFRKRVEDRRPLSGRWRSVKYVLLLVILSAALFGNLTLMVLDPITLMTRTMTASVLPALNHGITAVERVLYRVPLTKGGVVWVEALLRGKVLPVQQPVYGGNIIILVLFGAIIGLNAVTHRFWCRYLCPLGALLGLLSKVAFLRPMIGRSCNRCAECVGTCGMDAIHTEPDGFRISPSECIVCVDCLAACPRSGAGFEWVRPPAAQQPYDPSRRQALASLVGGAVGTAVLATGAHTRDGDPLLVRPPGVADEREFLSLCLRCSQCIKVCPTGGLQPVLLEAGLEGIWTPRLVPRLGYCDYGCHACTQICPSGAIPDISLALKRQVVMGVAVIDRNRCLPWAHGTPCIVCEEMCPQPEKAIRVEEVTVVDARGNEMTVQQPHVLEDLCIGCGICEYQCPVQGQAAIRVYRRV